MHGLLILIGGAALPSFVLIAWIYYKDRARPEPMRLIFRAVLFGFISTVGVFAIGLLIDVPSRFGGPVWSALWSAFITAALLEEATKAFILERFFYPNPAFDEVLDGVLYAMCVSLGFAFAENILYGFVDTSVLVLRAFSAVPLHASATGIMGYWYGLAKRSGNKVTARKMMRKGLVWAVLLHGSYNFFLMLGGSIAGLALLVLAAGFWRLLACIRLASVLDNADQRQLTNKPAKTLF